MGTVNENSSYSPVGPWVCLRVYWVVWFIFMLVYVLFYLGQSSHLPSCCGAGITNLNEPPSRFLLPSHYWGLGAGSIPLRAIVNKKHCETRGLFMSLVIHYWMGDVRDSQSQGVSVSQNANYNFYCAESAVELQSINQSINQYKLILLPLFINIVTRRVWHTSFTVTRIASLWFVSFFM